MEMKSKLFRTVNRTLTAILAVAIIFTLISPMTVQAKTKVTNITVKNHEDVYTVKDANKIAKKITKKGTYSVKINRKNSVIYEGYIKFVAPKKGNYTFVFSDVKSPNKDYVYGSVYGTKAYVNGELRDYLISPNHETLFFASYKKRYYEDYLTKRTAKAQLNKGEALYLFTFLRSIPEPKYVNFKLTIK